MIISIVIRKISNHLVQATEEADMYNNKVLLPWNICILKGLNNKRIVVTTFKNVGWRTEQWGDLPNGLGLSWEQNPACPTPQAGH